MIAKAKSAKPYLILWVDGGVKEQYQTYSCYLKGLRWNQIDVAVIARDNNRCRVCGAPGEVTHHLDYDRDTMKGVSLRWLVRLCEPCHARQHRKYDMETKETQHCSSPAFLKKRFTKSIEWAKSCSGPIRGFTMGYLFEPCDGYIKKAEEREEWCPHRINAVGRVLWVGEYYYRGHEYHKVLVEGYLALVPFRWMLQGVDGASDWEIVEYLKHQAVPVLAKTLTGLDPQVYRDDVTTAVCTQRTAV